MIEWAHKKVFFVLLINTDSGSIFSKPKFCTATISCHMVVEIMRACS